MDMELCPYFPILPRSSGGQNDPRPKNHLLRR